MGQEAGVSGRHSSALSRRKCYTSRIMSKHAPPTPKGIEPINLREALEERYLAYALSTIMHRALPDVRDGLKPVHRRLLYVMNALRLDPNAAFKKSAKIVGDVIDRKSVV